MTAKHVTVEGLRRALHVAFTPRCAHDENGNDCEEVALRAMPALLDDCLARRTRWHHNPDAPPEHFCVDCDAAEADAAALADLPELIRLGLGPTRWRSLPKATRQRVAEAIAAHERRVRGGE